MRNTAVCVARVISAVVVVIDRRRTAVRGVAAVDPRIEGQPVRAEER